MTPAINRAHDRLSDALEAPQRDTRKVCQSAVGLCLALNAETNPLNKSRHVAVRADKLADLLAFVGTIAAFTPGGKWAEDDADTINSVRREAKKFKSLNRLIWKQL